MKKKRKKIYCGPFILNKIQILRFVCVTCEKGEVTG